MQRAIATRIESAWKSLVDFFYPFCCTGCGKEMLPCERLLCSDCIGRLSFTGGERDGRNPVFLNLAGRFPVEHAAAVFHFRKQGVMQRLLHGLKYDGRQDIGFFLGRMAGERIRTDGIFPPPDYVVPVPLHKEKLEKRGYNQSLCIASGMLRSFPGTTLGDGLLHKKEATQSQTGKNRASRWENVKESFALDREAIADPRLRGKHFLLVDDVITTGATIESCARQLLRIPGSRVSAVALASPP